MKKNLIAAGVLHFVVAALTGLSAPVSAQQYVREVSTPKQRQADDSTMPFVRIEMALLGQLWPEELSRYGEIEPQGASVGTPMGKEATLEYSKVRAFTITLLPTACEAGLICADVTLNEIGGEIVKRHIVFTDVRQQKSVPWQDGEIRLTLKSL